MQTLRPFAVANPNEELSADPELDAADPMKGFGTQEQRERVKQAAENAIIVHYKSKELDCERVTHLRCGHGPDRLLKYTPPMRGTLFQRTAA